MFVGLGRAVLDQCLISVVEEESFFLCAHTLPLYDSIALRHHCIQTLAHRAFICISSYLVEVWEIRGVLPSFVMALAIQACTRVIRIL